MMWRVSSLYNPARNRLMSANTWAYSAARQRDVIAFQKNNRALVKTTIPTQINPREPTTITKTLVDGSDLFYRLAAYGCAFSFGYFGASFVFF